MGQYYIFMKVTGAGIASLEAVHVQLEGVAAELATAGTIANATIRMTFGGPFDFVADFQAESFEDAAYFATRLAATGNVTTTTARAYESADSRKVLMRGH